MLTVLDRRFANLRILIHPARVQGQGAAEDIADALRRLNRDYPEIDVLLLGRGGGSIEDLWAFNEEVLARAIAESKIPVISCVGHETDFTIADFVADLRAPTPSAAAELVIQAKKRTPPAVGRFVFAAFHRHGLQAGRPGAKAPACPDQPYASEPTALIEELLQDVDDARERLLQTMAHRMEGWEQGFAHAAEKLQLCLPGNLVPRICDRLEAAEKKNPQKRGPAAARRPD